VVFFRDEAGALSPFWRFAFVVAIFLFVWPPVCGILVFWLKFDVGLPLFGWFAFVGMYSYLFCAPSALLAGVATAVAAIGFRQNSVIIPVLAAVLAAVLLLAVTGWPASLKQLTDALVIGFPFMLLGSLIASLICWWLTRQFARTA
jgi:hypothetical protein